MDKLESNNHTINKGYGKRIYKPKPSVYPEDVEQSVGFYKTWLYGVCLLAQNLRLNADIQVIKDTSGVV